MMSVKKSAAVTVTRSSLIDYAVLVLQLHAVFMGVTRGAALRLKLFIRHNMKKKKSEAYHTIIPA